jgi:hypothetical protein
MARGIPPLLGSFYADLHRQRGVICAPRPASAASLTRTAARSFTR